MIGVRASVSIGETRTINVFVLGEAKFPGSYTVTGLATVTTALFAAGGVKPQGCCAAFRCGARARWSANSTCTTC